MQHQIIDINVDMGEGIDNESQIMPYISSCNIACGGHAGDFDSMYQVSELAKKHNVKIGAHPSFPDKVNFGRKAIKMPHDALKTSIKSQIQDLIVVLNTLNLPLHHVKPHGALYNLAAIDDTIANCIIEVIKSLSLPVKLYVPYNSVIAKCAIEEGINIVYEAFADRNYNDDLTLVSRTQKDAVIHDSEMLFEHVYSMMSTKKVKTLQGNYKTIKAETFCIHGDNPEAKNLILNLVEKLNDKGVKVN